MNMPSTNLLDDFWRRVTGFFTHLDAKAVRAFWMSLLLLGSVVAVFLIGKSAWGQSMTLALETWMRAYQNSPLAIVIVILVFCVSSLFGAPQFVLIAACVVAFGPVWGFTYSWVATVISAAMNFYIGRFAGAGVLQKVGGNHLAKFSHYLGKNTFSASFIIRNIPSAPFIVVNMAFGAARAPFLAFIGGCALGILPKTALVALFGTSYSSLMKGGNWKMAVAMAALAVVWLGLMLLARHFYQRGKERG